MLNHQVDFYTTKIIFALLLAAVLTIGNVLSNGYDDCQKVNHYVDFSSGFGVPLENPIWMKLAAI